MFGNQLYLGILNLCNIMCYVNDGSIVSDGQSLLFSVRINEYIFFQNVIFVLFVSLKKNLS